MLQQLFTIILAMILLKERLAWTGYTGIGLALLGSLFLSVEKKKMTISYHEYIRSYIVYFDPIMNKYLGIVFFLTLL